MNTQRNSFAVDHTLSAEAQRRELVSQSLEGSIDLIATKTSVMTADEAAACAKQYAEALTSFLMKAPPSIHHRTPEAFRRAINAAGAEGLNHITIAKQAYLMAPAADGLKLEAVTTNMKEAGQIAEYLKSKAVVTNVVRITSGAYVLVYAKVVA